MAIVRTFQLECPEACSLKPGSRVGHKVSEMMVAGVTYRTIVENVRNEDGYVLYPGTMTRHKRHIVITGKVREEEPIRSQASNIQILETIIQKGFQNSKNWKPTISDTMKAMDMWFRLTQGNPFDDLLDTLAKASLGEGLEEEETNPSAIGTVEEMTPMLLADAPAEEEPETALA